MRLFEYQAKQLFAEAGISVPKSICIDSSCDISQAIEGFVLPCALKSQVLQGGRGKAGLIQFALSKDEACKKAHQLFARIGANYKLLVEQKFEVAQELYLAVTVDPSSGSALVLASKMGGIDIEEVSKKDSHSIVRELVDVRRGLMPFQVRNILFGLKLEGDIFKKTGKVLTGLFEVFQKYDAELVEINPLIVTTDGQLVAGDGKVSIDDNAVFRQNRFAKTRECFDSEIEYQAAQDGIPYLQFSGDIGLMCAGAGLTNTVYDLINDYGGTVANYLEFGGPNYKKAVRAMELTLKANPKVILIVTFGTIARADVMAQGIVEAIEKLKPSIPIVLAIRGTGEEEAQKILSAAGLTPLFDTEEAVRRAVELAKRGK